MNYTGYELLWIFFVYSFLGWVLETIVAATKQKQFVNRGLINGPFCVLYGFTGAVLSIYLQELHGAWLFVGSALLATVMEWVAGHLIERLYHERWWNYKNIRWNLDGYICLPISALWGVLGVVAVRWGSPSLARVYRLCPSLPAKIVIWILLAVITLDVAATLVIMSGRSRTVKRWEAADAWFARVSSRIGKWIYEHTESRIHKAYPAAEVLDKTETKPEVFAYGCGFYKVVILFFVGAFLGDLTETVFCRITAGEWMSRSSVVWGPFSIVWGLGIAAVTAMLYRYKDRSDGFLFVVGMFLGGAYEYLCSVFTEIVFGTVFWDYSWMPFNLGGRINLLYCFFWGIAAVIWFKKLYPKISSLIEKISVLPGKIITWILIVFMVCNMAVSSLALLRYDERQRGVPAEQSWQQTMDERFDDARMERIYPNALTVE